MDLLAAQIVQTICYPTGNKLIRQWLEAMPKPKQYMISAQIKLAVFMTA